MFLQLWHRGLETELESERGETVVCYGDSLLHRLSDGEGSQLHHLPLWFHNINLRQEELVWSKRQGGGKVFYPFMAEKQNRAREEG